ncbi:hypothetical protein DPMN_126299 [Dreissena polymorpha]|uniref:Uncharacterized protein n=1 Tax=Dreissena polymorpha TaxID=45954 RepID=A0A9D4JY03_DREPO|nr:hypothetical protein DPMN_126299 [Dreissena polymorpha]
MARSDSTTRTFSTATCLLQSDGNVRLHYQHVYYGYVPPSERWRGQTPLTARLIRLRTSFRAMARSDSTNRTSSTATYLLQSDGEIRLHYPHVKQYVQTLHDVMLYALVLSGKQLQQVERLLKDVRHAAVDFLKK